MNKKIYLIGIVSMLALALVLSSCSSGDATRSIDAKRINNTNPGNQTNRTGSLAVTTTPTQASLYVDNVYKGLTPYTVSGLSLGNHAVRITKTGYQTYTETATITAGPAYRIIVDLVQINNSGNQTGNQTGNLSVATMPSGANLYVDNVNRGLTPNTISGLSVGNHQVRLTKTGYQTYTETATITTGLTYRIIVDLVPVNQSGGNQTGNNS